MFLAVNRLGCPQAPCCVEQALASELWLGRLGTCGSGLGAGQPRRVIWQTAPWDRGQLPISQAMSS